MGNLTTNQGLNNVSDTAPTYEDRAYGGAGKDVLIANTGGDRLIDWVGEYNSYLVPFSEFGMATVSRTMQPQLQDFLYAESAADGADPTRYADLNGGAAAPAATKNDPNPGRNGEPAGELGLVLQQDSAWHGQTGAPTDPQAGNLPGTQRDVLRTANFSGNGPTAMFADSGTWSVSGGAYQNSTTSGTGDNISLFDLNTWLPSYYEVTATAKVTGGTRSDAFIIFDYHSATDFKFAGMDVANNQLVIGQRSEAGWTNLATLTVKGLGLNKNNSFMLAANGATATVSLGTYALSYRFAAPLNTGLTGVGTNNSLASFTAYAVQQLPINYTYAVLEDFSDGVANAFTPATGTWTTTSGTTGRYTAVPPAGDAAVTLRPLSVAPLSYVEYSATVNVATSGGRAGLVFDSTSSGNFLYAAIVAGTNQVVLGHRSNGVWTVDATANVTINAGSDYTLMVALVEGTTNTVNVVLNGKSVTSFTYGSMVHDGGVGLFTSNGKASFDNVLIRGDDVAYAGGGSPLVADTASNQPDGTNVGILDTTSIDAAIAEAKRRWIASGLVSAESVLALGEIQVQIADLQGLTLSLANEAEHSIIVDGNAAGYGWFVDPTLSTDAEFARLVSADESAATAGSQANGHMDLLTVVEHEVGHLLGLEHGSSDVMSETLEAGLRITPRVPSALPFGPVAMNAPPAIASLAPVIDSHLSGLEHGSPDVMSETPAAGLHITPQAPSALPFVWAAMENAALAVPSVAVVIDWEGGSRQTRHKEISSTAPHWYGDFVNHLAQSAAERNPNAGLRVHLPSVSKAAPAVSIL